MSFGEHSFQSIHVSVENCYSGRAVERGPGVALPMFGKGKKELVLLVRIKCATISRKYAHATWMIIQRSFHPQGCSWCSF